MSCKRSTVANVSLSENSLYVGINLQSILYGIQLGLYFKTTHVFLSRRKEPRKTDVLYAVLSSVMLLLITIRVATEGVYGEKMWLINRNYPGGPFAYGKAHATDAYMDLGAAAVVILQLITDAFMIYRCQLVWGNLRVIVVPSILWLANFALGVLVSWGSAAPWMVFFDGISTKLEVAYTTVSVALNLMLTCMIWYRLMRHARTAKECHEEDEWHLGIDTLIIESMLPYTLCGIALLTTCGVGNATAIAFSCVYTLMMCISPQMLILRMAEDRAWKWGRVAGDGVSRGTERSEGSGPVELVHLETFK